MQAFDLTINITIREKPETAGYSYGNALEVRETVTVTATGFMEAAAILGKFHELAKAQQKPE